MRPFYIFIATGLLICGCQGTGPAKVDNPVLPPPPPRLPPDQIRKNQDDYAGQYYDKTDESRAQRFASREPELSKDEAIQPVSLETIDPQNPPAFDDGMVVAMVNDQPIFAGDMLAPAAGEIKSAEAKMKQHYGKEYKPEMLHRIRAALVKRDLGRAIQRKILVQAAKAEFKKEQLAALTRSIEGQWSEHLQELMQQNQVTSEAEVAELFAANHFDLADHKAAFFDEQTAMNYVSYKAHSRFEPTRKEMLKYYDEHAEEYEFPSRVHWQQLVISFEERGGREKAAKHLDQVVQQLLAGADFTEVIKQHGDGPKASAGGIWDWTVKGSLANKEIEKELFSLPVGEMSGVIETSSGYQIVVVLNRQDAGRKSFESLQKEIENKLKSEAFQEKAKEVIRESQTASTIITVFDSPEDRRRVTANRNTAPEVSSDEPSHASESNPGANDDPVRSELMSESTGSKDSSVDPNQVQRASRPGTGPQRPFRLFRPKGTTRL